MLVTGASSGIGAAVSVALAERRARVFGTGRDSAALKAVCGHFVATLARDLTEPGAPEAVVTAAAESLDGLDVVISNAGAGWFGPLESMTTEEIDTVLDINLRAPVHLAHAASPHLRDSIAGGQFVIVASIVGLVGVYEEVVYSTAKTGLRGLADSLRWEWREGVNGDSKGRLTVTLVSPGAVDTPFFSRRNRYYVRSWPRKTSVDAVARAIVAAVERRQVDVVVPKWMALPARLNGGWPSLYRAIGPPLDRVLGRLPSGTDQGRLFARR